MKCQRFILLTLATVGSFVLYSVRVSAKTPVSPIFSSISTFNVTTPTVDSITQQIAQLEVRHGMLNAVYTPYHPVIRSIEQKLLILHLRLAKLQPNIDDTDVNTAISKAITMKMKQLEAKRTKLQVRYTPKHPSIRLIDAQLRNLDQLLHHHS